MHLSSLYTSLIYDITIYYLARIPERKNKNEINSRALYYRILVFLTGFFFFSLRRPPTLCSSIVFIWAFLHLMCI